jgi:uncharacterized membrane protein YhaH (DUF805 family)
MEQPDVRSDELWSSTPDEPRRYQTDHAGRGISWLLFSLEGRVPRLQYWLVHIGLAFFYQFMVQFLKALRTGLDTKVGSPPVGAHTIAVTFLALLAVLVAFGLAQWIGFALTVKRWHDRDRPWTFALLGFVPFVGWLWQFIECGCMDGTLGPNRHGPSPKGITAVVYGDPVADAFN